MPIIRVQILKIIEKHENKKQKKRTRGGEAIAKGWEINDFVERLG